MTTAAYSVSKRSASRANQASDGATTLSTRTNVIHATGNTEKGGLLKTACGLPAYTGEWLRRPCDVEIVRYVDSLKIPAYAHAKRTELIEFGRAQGLETLERQVELGKATHRCCWEPKDGPHHPVCASKRKSAR